MNGTTKYPFATRSIRLFIIRTSIFYWQTQFAVFLVFTHQHQTHRLKIDFYLRILKEKFVFIYYWRCIMNANYNGWPVVEHTLLLCLSILLFSWRKISSAGAWLIADAWLFSPFWLDGQSIALLLELSVVLRRIRFGAKRWREFRDTYYGERLRGGQNDVSEWRKIGWNRRRKSSLWANWRDIKIYGNIFVIIGNRIKFNHLFCRLYETILAIRWHSRAHNQTFVLTCDCLQSSI